MRKHENLNGSLMGDISGTSDKVLKFTVGIRRMTFFHGTKPEGHWPRWKSGGYDPIKVAVITEKKPREVKMLADPEPFRSVI